MLGQSGPLLTVRRSVRLPATGYHSVLRRADGRPAIEVLCSLRKLRREIPVYLAATGLTRLVRLTTALPEPR
ncbi:hypothetical protein BIV25_19850 [Streptomyces sp. MUSC 14]|nr:hypothetical protein BIV25_19850 [Streptomyces sp. MUSC 14]